MLCLETGCRTGVWHKKGDEVMTRDFAARRTRLIDALRSPPRFMQDRLDALTAHAVRLSARDDLVWYLLLQSMSTLRSSRGHRYIFPNGLEPGSSITFLALSRLSPTDRKTVLGVAFKSVLKGKEKAGWLDRNFERIECMGGEAGALATMRSLPSMDAKTHWVSRFDGIGEKYKRNIWMDIRDAHFEQSIAVDIRLEEVGALTGMNPSAPYEEKERFFLGMAREAGISGWEADRLLYNFKDELLALAGIPQVGGDGKRRKASAC